MKCKLCPNIIGKRYVTLIGPAGEDVFQICWECKPLVKTEGTAYHPSFHDDGPPPPEGTQK